MTDVAMTADDRPKAKRSNGVAHAPVLVSGNKLAFHFGCSRRGSKLAGVDVYNEANEKIGDVNDVILDRSGKVSNVILGVGGVLGLGEHYVAVPFDKLTWVDQPATATTASTTSAPANAPTTTSAPDGTARTTTGAATTTTTATTTTASNRWYPDRAVYNATKDELKAMPEFKY